MLRFVVVIAVVIFYFLFLISCHFLVVFIEIPFSFFTFQIGIELMKKPKFLLLDEATTGLDTARSVEIGKFCRIVADNFVPVLAALLQPPLRFPSSPPSSLPLFLTLSFLPFHRLYKRFDHILLMHEGRVAFFGPRVKVLEYFEEIGFRCPNWMNPADFLVAVLVRPDDFRIGDDRIVQTARDFADVYSQSAMYREIVLPMIRENYPDGVEPEEEPREWKRKKTENPLSRLRTTFSSFSKESKEYQGEDGDDEDQEILSPADDEEIEMRPPAFLGKQHQSFISDRRPNLTMKSQIESGPPPPTKFNTSAFFQFKMLTKRGLQSNRNFPAMIIFISIYSLFLATFYGTLFLQLGYTQADLSLRAGIVFNIVMILGFQVGLFYLFFIFFFTFLNTFSRLTKQTIHYSKNVQSLSYKDLNVITPPSHISSLK